MKLKKHLVFGAAALLLASCANEDVYNPGQTEGVSNVSFTLNLSDGLQSRSFGDGTTAKFLQYQLYNKNDDGTYEKVTLDGYSGKISDFYMSHTLNFQLLNGNTYRLVAVADNFGKTGGTGAHVVSFKSNGATIENQSSYHTLIKDEKGDLFWASQEFTVNGDLNGVIEMKRAVAQINFGTNDYEVAESLGFSGIKAASITPSKAYRFLNLLDGEATEPFVLKVFNSEAYTLKDTEKFPVEGYKYMAMAYVFVGNEQELFDLTLTYTPNGKTAQKRTIASVPVQRNHRTNIYGSILTSKLDLTIEIEPMFDEPGLEPDDFSKTLGFGGIYTFSDDYIINSQKDVTAGATIDLNGHTVTSNVALSSGSSQAVPILVTTNGSLTIKGDKEGSKMTTGEGATSHVVGVMNGGTVVVESGYFETSVSGPLFYIGYATANKLKSTVYIKGGTFKNGTPSSASQNFLLNCEDAAFNNGTAEFIVSGGTFYNFNPEHSNAEPGLDHNWVAPGYKVISYEEGDDMVYVVVPNETIEVSADSDFATAIANINSSTETEVTVFVASGNYETKSGNASYTEWPSNKTINFVGQGADKTFITKMDYFTANGSTVNFKNLSLKVTENSTNHTSLGLRGVKESNFENVDIFGEWHIFDGDATFKNCNFYFAGGGNNQTRYGLYEESDGNVVIENCVFDTSCKEDDNRETKAILVYSTVHENLGNLTVKDTEFIVTGKASTKAAIEVHSELFKSAGVLTIDNVTLDESKFQYGLWREVDGSTPTNFFKVIVNGDVKQDGTQTRE